MSLKSRKGRRKGKVSEREMKRRYLKSCLDKMGQQPNKTERDYELIQELEESLRRGNY